LVDAKNWCINVMILEKESRSKRGKSILIFLVLQYNDQYLMKQAARASWSVPNAWKNKDHAKRAA